MKKIIKFLRLPLNEKYLFITSVFLFMAFNIGLSLFSFKSVLKFLDKIKNKELKDKYCPPEEKIVRIVDKAGRYVPYTTCLIKALTAKVLLKRYGYFCNLQIGVVKNEKGDIDAHAWLESHGRIIIGDLKDLSRFNVFPSLEK